MTNQICKDLISKRGHILRPWDDTDLRRVNPAHSLNRDHLVSILGEQHWVNLEIWMLIPGPEKVLQAAKESRSMTGQSLQGKF